MKRDEYRSERAEAVLGAIGTHPGVFLTEAAALVGVDRTTAEYHVHRLARAGRIVRVRHGNRLHLFVNGSGLSETARKLIILGEDRATIIEALQLEGRPSRPSDLARRTGLPIGRVRYGLSVAVDLGLAQHAPGGYYRLPVERPAARRVGQTRLFMACTGCRGTIWMPELEGSACPYCGLPRASGEAIG